MRTLPVSVFLVANLHVWLRGRQSEFLRAIFLFLLSVVSQPPLFRSFLAKDTPKSFFVRRLFFSARSCSVFWACTEYQ